MSSFSLQCGVVPRIGFSLPQFPPPFARYLELLFPFFSSVCLGCSVTDSFAFFVTSLPQATSLVFFFPPPGSSESFPVNWLRTYAPFNPLSFLAGGRVPVVCRKPIAFVVPSSAFCPSRTFFFALQECLPPPRPLI